MGLDKIAAFYDDLEKRADDQRCEEKSYSLRAVSTSTGPYWAAQPWGRFMLHGLKGALGALRMRLRDRALLTPIPPGVLNPPILSDVAPR